MERIEIIKEEVKSNLSQFGLNDSERLEYENMVSELYKNTELSEEDFVKEVKKSVSLFIPSVKLLQKSRTTLQQANADNAKEITDLKKALEDAKKNQDKGNTQTQTTTSDNKELLDAISTLKNEITTMKEEREQERKNNAIKEKKSQILKVVKGQYNKNCEVIIDLLADKVDFSQDNALDLMKAEAADFAKSHPTQLFVSENTDKHDDKAINKLFGIAKDEADTERQKAFENRLI